MTQRYSELVLEETAFLLKCLSDMFQMCNMSIHQSATRRKGNVKVGCLSWFGQGRGGDRNRQTGNLLSGSILIQLMSTTGHSKLTHYKIQFSQ